MKTIILTLSLLCIVGTSAFAEDVAPSDVSQINGQLVPVGVHGEYLYSHPTFNIATNPLTAFAGVYGLAVSYAATPNVAIKIDGTYINIIDSDDEGFEVNLTAPIYFRKVFTGMYIEPGLLVRDFDMEQEDGSTQVGPQVLVGYHFTADNGLNVSVAAGLGRDLGGDKEVMPNGYLRVGYAF